MNHVQLQTLRHPLYPRHPKIATGNKNSSKVAIQQARLWNTYNVCEPEAQSSDGPTCMAELALIAC